MVFTELDTMLEDSILFLKGKLARIAPTLTEFDSFKNQVDIIWKGLHDLSSQEVET